jgi:hypothetical protein
MKTILFRTIALISLVTGGFFFGGCSGGEGDTESGESLPITGLIIHNRSQFELEHLFVYTPTLTYEVSENLLDSNLKTGEMIFHRLPEGAYLVTVSRRPNATADLLAYTASEPILLDRPKVVEYYDTEFRVYDLKLTVSADPVNTNETAKAARRAESATPAHPLPFVETWME